MGVKLETAYAAGCKTLIIPRENLTGTEGIDRLPDALKHELQILTYDQWKGSHEPFDYSKHVLQVVAVDDIVQASQVAFIEQEEIDSLDRLFEEHAQEALAELASAAFRELRVVYLDSPEETDPGKIGADLCLENHGCSVLVRSDFKEEISRKLDELSVKSVIREFDPRTERLVDVLRETKIAGGEDYSSPPLRISLIAPLPFLRKEAIRPEYHEGDAAFEGLRIFANCCTAENVPVRDCRAILSRSLSYLVKLTDELLGKCPFLSKKDGIYAPTVAFIPEKYRLDSRRAEEILDRCLSKWLNIVEKSKEEPEAPMIQPGMKL
jgi:ATP-dependent Lon protease